MARQYTAWVIQNGKGEGAEYVHFRSSGAVLFTNEKQATQFGRRMDANGVLANLKNRYPEMYTERRFRPVEKQFG